MRIECDSCFEEKQTLLFLDKPEYLEVGNFKRKKYLFLGGKLIFFFFVLLDQKANNYILVVYI